VAILGERVVGFTQLYPSFSSVSVGRTWILNDLCVEESARGRGIGRALMRAARDFAEADGALRLELATERTNAAGQALYETEGYVRDDSFLHYSLPLR
ncbi:MAG: GNAT family N-acetyltransferase, partial [Planctomycetota bacterium]